jgi:hypothetical protein
VLGKVQFAFDAGVGGDDGEVEVFRHGKILMKHARERRLT